MLGNNVLSLHDLSIENIQLLFKAAINYKTNPEKFNNNIYNKRFALIFENEYSLDNNIYRFSIEKNKGYVLNISDNYLDDKKNTNAFVKTLSKLSDCIIIENNNHDKIIDASYQSDVPVVNAGSKLSLPCSVLSDIFLVFEELQKTADFNILYIGFADAISNDLMYATAKLGINLFLNIVDKKLPKKYIIDNTTEIVKKSGSIFEIIPSLNLTDNNKYDIIFINCDSSKCNASDLNAICSDAEMILFSEKVYFNTFNHDEKEYYSKIFFNQQIENRNVFYQAVLNALLGKVTN
jgi:ornithine carbamoyltransferase